VSSRYSFLLNWRSRNRPGIIRPRTKIHVTIFQVEMAVVHGVLNNVVLRGAPVIVGSGDIVGEFNDHVHLVIDVTTRNVEFGVLAGLTGEGNSSFKICDVGSRQADPITKARRTINVKSNSVLVPTGGNHGPVDISGANFHIASDKRTPGNVNSADTPVDITTHKFAS